MENSPKVHNNMEEPTEVIIPYNKDSNEEIEFYCSPIKEIENRNGEYGECDSDSDDDPRLIIDESLNSRHNIEVENANSGNSSSDDKPEKSTKRKRIHKPVKKTIRKMKPITSILTKVERAIICNLGSPKYNKNMVRQFVSSAKTSEEQLKRNKNTEAARNSRTLAKFAEEKLMQNVISGRQRNDGILMDILTSLSSIAKWQKDLGLPPVDWRNEWLAEVIRNEDINCINVNCNYINDKNLICNAFR